MGIDILDDFSSSEGQVFSRLLFLLFMFIVQILLLNLLIAIMTATHERVSGTNRITLQKARADLVMQQMATLKAFGCGFYDKFAAENVNLFRLNPVSRRKKNVLTEWAGYSNAAKDYLDNALKQQLESFKAEVGKVKNDVFRNTAM